MCSLRDLSISITMEVQLVCLHLLLTQCDSDLTLGMLKKKEKKGGPLRLSVLDHSPL